MNCPYKVEHAYPNKYRVISMGGWGNCEYEDAEEIDSQRDYAESHNSCKDLDLHVGEGLWRWLKPAEPIEIRVEDLYENISEDFWYIIDDFLKDRKDLQERIAEYKQKKKKKQWNSYLRS